MLGYRHKLAVWLVLAAPPVGFPYYVDHYRTACKILPAHHFQFHNLDRTSAIPPVLIAFDLLF